MKAKAMCKRSLVALVLALISSVGLRAQTAEQKAAATRSVTEAMAVDTSPDAILAPAVPTILLESDKDNSRLIGRIGWTNGYWLGQVEASAPIREGTKEVDLLNLNGVTGGSSVTGTIARQWLRIPKLPTTICERFNRERIDTLKAERRILLLERDHCTLPDLAENSTPKHDWEADGNRAIQAALQKACDDLNKLAGGKFASPLLSLELIPPKAPSKPAPGVPLPGGKLVPPPGYLDIPCSEDTFDLTDSSSRIFEVQKRLTEERLTLEVRLKKLGTPSLKPEILEKERLEKRRDEITKTLSGELFVDSKGAIDRIKHAALEPVCEAYNHPDIATLITDDECNTSDVVATVAEKAKTVGARDFLAQSFGFSVWGAALQATATDQPFKFRETVPDADHPGQSALTDPMQDKKVGVGVTLSLYNQIRNNFWRLGYNKQQKYEGQDPTLVCEGFPNVPGASSCADASIGRPTRKVEDLAVGEYRRFLGPRMGMTFRPSYSFDRSNLEIHTLLHILRSKQDGGLTGGLDLGWTAEPSKRDAPHWTLRLFVGTTAFSLNP